MVPAAGYATRLQPLAMSKEMVPVGGRPVVDHLLERMRAVPAAELRVVTRPEKADLIAHARRRGAEVVLGRPRNVSESLLFGLAGLAPANVVLIGFPDTLWQPADGFPRLVGALDADHDLALGLLRGAELERSDVVALDAGRRPTGVAVKPAVPPSSWIWACAAGRVRALGGLRFHREPGHHFHTLCRRGRVAVVTLSDRFLDIGTPEGLRRAQSAESRVGSPLEASGSFRGEEARAVSPP